MYQFQCDEGVGIYELRQSSFIAVPYYGTNQIIFLDSLGNQTLFILNEAQAFLSDGKFIKYNVFEPFLRRCRKKPNINENRALKNECQAGTLTKELTNLSARLYIYSSSRFPPL